MKSSWFNFKRIFNVIKILAILGLVIAIVAKRADLRKIFAGIITSLMAILAKINPFIKLKK